MNTLHWLRVDRVIVNPKNTLAVKTALAGASARDVAYSHRANAERETVDAAIAKRERRAAKRRGEVQAS